MNEPLRQQFVNKTTRFNFQDEMLQFELSQSLFSSASVDDGSRLLLKYCLHQLDLAQLLTVLDIGCGVGVLGLSLQKLCPQLTISVQERDALALAFTKANAELNDLDIPETIPGLGLQNLHGRHFDLILSNLPGKAGQPVLEKIVAGIPRFLSPTGRAGIVVVNPLAEVIKAALDEIGSKLLYETRSSRYTILFFKGGTPAPPAADPLARYRRATAEFADGRDRYNLSTVYNLPDFDSAGYATRLAFKMMDALNVRGRLLFWNPGHGHVPAVVAVRSSDDVTDYTLGGRDLLSLQISARNLERQDVAQQQITLGHVATICEVAGSFDTIVLFPDFDAGVPWSRLLPAALERLLASGGQALIVAKSGFCGRLLAANNQLRLGRQKKYHGLRAVILEKV